MMHFIKRLWATGKKGKATLGCGGLLFLCSLCTMITLVWSVTPAGREATARQNATATVAAAKAATVAALTATAQPTGTPEPTHISQPSHTPQLGLTPESVTTPLAGISVSPTPVPTATASAPPTGAPSLAPSARRNANLRSGPGIDFPVVGSATAGATLDVRARTAAGDWLLLASGVWISADLVADAPTVPVTVSIPTLPVTSERLAAPGSGSHPNVFTCIGGCATPPDPSCAIKGNVNSQGEKIFHVPGQRDYERTDIKFEEGDRWFCTSEEAEAAGFRPAQR